MLTGRENSESARAPIDGLVRRIVTAWRPSQIWLFGSRARGEEGPESDWDLLVIVPDDLDESALDPVSCWTLVRGSGVRADVVPCRLGDFTEDRDTPNTLAFEAMHRGVLLYEH